MMLLLLSAQIRASSDVTARLDPHIVVKTTSGPSAWYGIVTVLGAAIISAVAAYFAAKLAQRGAQQAARTAADSAKDSAEIAAAQADVEAKLTNERLRREEAFRTVRWAAGIGVRPGATSEAVEMSAGTLNLAQQHPSLQDPLDRAYIKAILDALVP